MWPSPDGQRDEESYGVVRLREGKSGQQVGRSSILLLAPCTVTLAVHGSSIFTYRVKCARCIQTVLFCQKTDHKFPGLIGSTRHLPSEIDGQGESLCFEHHELSQYRKQAVWL